MISVETKDLWSTAGLMPLAYVCPVIEMFILQMPFLGATRGPFCVKGAILNLLQLGVLKRRSHFVKIAIGLGMVALPQLQTIRGRQLTVTLVALQQLNFLGSGLLS